MFLGGIHIIQTILTLPQAIAALTDKQPLLLSAPAAAQSLGVGGWLALVAEARRQVPGVP